MYFCLFVCLRARHDHNKTAPCGMIKVFEFEFELAAAAAQLTMPK